MSSVRFAVVGRSNLEFRWDVFNLFNHPGFGFPNSAIGNATAGRITTTIVDNRSMQFALTAIVFPAVRRYEQFVRNDRQSRTWVGTPPRANGHIPASHDAERQ